MLLSSNQFFPSLCCQQWIQGHRPAVKCKSCLLKKLSGSFSCFFVSRVCNCEFSALGLLYCRGETWGENGYFRLARNSNKKEGTCGIAMAASYPIKTHPNPRSVPEVCGMQIFATLFFFFFFQPCQLPVAKLAPNQLRLSNSSLSCVLNGDTPFCAMCCQVRLLLLSFHC